ncbi:amidohydrolase [Pseudonocardia sulfidoxydans NBRC 16205]|uniref:Amidohydrolase n=1 Tax=Pseudonocardia sulfidoxydans NBRC 16205 TaxID=1223511 RepID=A0A511DPY3_9PSEU|nr:amidohydrolase family protein [Pseudonocardia sulfidoxydans]GEL26293.1 amidohydrolase [Pseudonocardia sulfidoxydans NBRC 16205]
MTVVIDSHAHLVPRSLLADLHSGAVRFPSIEVTAHEETFRVAFGGGAPTRPVAPGLTDNARRLAWLTDNGIDLQVTGGWLDIFGYDLPADEGADWAEVLTDGLRAAAVPERQVVLGTVPLQDAARAATALRAQRAAGLPGVMIATRAGATELADDALRPFWEAADETGAVVFLHPGFAGASPRYQDFGLVNGLARLEDTTVALARMLYAGIPARYPGARIVVAHAGAALPYVLGRLVRNHLLHPDATRDPLESFAHLYFDSVVFDSDALRFLVEKAGPERVLMGSDYPFPIGDLEPGAVVDAAKLPDAQRVMLTGENARRLFLGDGS